MNERKTIRKLPDDIEAAIASMPEPHRTAIRRAYQNAEMRDVDSWIIPNSSKEFDPSVFLTNAALTKEAFHSAARQSIHKISSK